MSTYRITLVVDYDVNDLEQLGRVAQALDNAVRSARYEPTRGEQRLSNLEYDPALRWSISGRHVETSMREIEKERSHGSS